MFFKQSLNVPKPQFSHLRNGHENSNFFHRSEKKICKALSMVLTHKDGTIVTIITVTVVIFIPPLPASTLTMAGVRLGAVSAERGLV